MQAAMLDGFSLDPFTSVDDGFCSAEVGISRRNVAQALVITLVIIVFDERLDLGFQISGQEVVLQQDAVFERLVLTLDLALRLWMERRAANVAHIPFREIVRQIASNIAGAIIFNRAQRHGVDRVTSIADDEQFAQASAEKYLGRDSAVRTCDIGCKRRLSLRDLEPALASYEGSDRHIVQKVLIAFDQHFQRLVRRQSGLAVHHPGWGVCATVTPEPAAIVPPATVAPTRTLRRDIIVSSFRLSVEDEK